jgi:hypothetical protein
MWIFLLGWTFLLELLSFLLCFSCGVASVAFLALLIGYPSDTVDPHIRSYILRTAIIAGWGHVLIVALIYAFLIIPVGLLWPLFERMHLGVREPTMQELITMDMACASLASTASDHGMPFKRPRRWRVLDRPYPSIRYIGWTLVIDRGLLESRFFEPLLAHELAYSRSSDKWAKTLLRFFAPKWCVFGFLLGLGLGVGPLIMWLPWKWYWRKRVYAADQYAARLGQRFQLIIALETLFLPLDAATKFGTITRNEPYVALRIDRLRRLII